MATTTITGISKAWGTRDASPPSLDSYKNKSPRRYKCGSFTLVSEKLGKAVRLRCGSWSCTPCGKRLARKYAARVRGVVAERFLTLTMDPKRFTDPVEAAKALCRMFGMFAKRVRRRFGKDSFASHRNVVTTAGGNVPHTGDNRFFHALDLSPNHVTGQRGSTGTVDTQNYAGHRFVVFRFLKRADDRVAAHEL